MMLFLCICCLLGASDCRDAGMAGVWLAAAVGFAAVGVFG